MPVRVSSDDLELARMYRRKFWTLKESTQTTVESTRMSRLEKLISGRVGSNPVRVESNIENSDGKLCYPREFWETRFRLT